MAAPPTKSVKDMTAAEYRTARAAAISAEHTAHTRARDERDVAQVRRRFPDLAAKADLAAKQEDGA